MSVMSGLGMNTTVMHAAEWQDLRDLLHLRPVLEVGAIRLAAEDGRYASVGIVAESEALRGWVTGASISDQVRAHEAFHACPGRDGRQRRVACRTGTSLRGAAARICAPRA